jgi:hypothetical protein
MSRHRKGFAVGAVTQNGVNQDLDGFCSRLPVCRHRTPQTWPTQRLAGSRCKAIESYFLFAFVT